MSITFVYDERLGISIPNLSCEWKSLSQSQQENTISEWETYRGDIPERVKEIEHEINQLQERLYIEDDFDRSCHLNEQISELASVINDLWIWYRTNASVTESKTHF
ncbi:hypothetical protein [Evansella halocellulosilytica]|uniref:hypothetical protein n=1 Tax=Evansella halocellulosilytica TaxID=2011013 RepID=UPI000BB99370|nr:hypothetical protein [Evansella halocellulosilytica]